MASEAVPKDSGQKPLGVGGAGATELTLQGHSHPLSESGQKSKAGSLR